MTEIFEYEFIRNAIFASILASVACGIVGSFIVVKKLTFISGGIAHTAYGGVGLGYLLGINPLFGAIFFSLIASTSISIMRSKKNQSEDTLIGIMWALGMALGIIFISLSPGYAPDLMSYLFGNILAVSLLEIYLMIILNIIIVAVVMINFKKLQAVTFDEEYSRAMGINVDRYYFILYLLIALTVVLLIKVAGIILVIALLSIPASISLNFTKSIGRMITNAIFIGVGMMLLGLFLSYYLNLPSGSVIIIVSSIAYMLIYFYKSIGKRREK
jgi:zinc transport system permease protein